MTSVFSYVAKSFGLVIFSSSIVAIFFRLLVLGIVIFFVLPKFYLGLASLIVRVQLFLLSALLCEFLSSKVYGVIQGSNYELKDKKPIRQPKDPLSSALAHNKVSLFVHTKNVSIAKLIPKSMYKECTSDTENTVRVFDHHQRPIVSIEIEALRQGLKSFIIYPGLVQILGSIKKGRSNIVTFVMSAQDLALCFSQKELLIAIHGFAFELGSFLRRKVNINLIIEDMHSITGFDNFLKFQNALDLMSFSLYGSQKTTKGFIEVFEESFTRFNDKIDFAIRCNNFLQPIEAQNVITFSQQLQYLKEPLKEVIASLFLISSNSGLFNRTLVSVYFLSSSDVPCKSDILSKELHSCLR